MSWITLGWFIPACFALNMSPGPNNLLALSNAKRYSWSHSCLAGLGRLAAFAVMIALSASGLATLLYASEVFFTAVKIIGALYLFWLALQLWRADHSLETRISDASLSLFALARQECLLAAGNPKAILIFTAFLPQFVDPSAAVGQQFLILGSCFLLLEWVAIGLYAGAGRLLDKGLAKPSWQRAFNKVCAVLLGSAGLGLLLSKRLPA
ncbi:LysE family translocator [Saccharospirillum mangrovi]|uniref:LysE family translocator n=1 Tax=Saccharospirillum mangrovi TaxID=2161747 RepID=UPI000D3AB0BD|nr:LysE family translocator [Saccharospirillum mangrovi]